MVSWFVGESENGADICTARGMTELRNWAAGLDIETPVFFALNPWDGVVAPNDVLTLAGELEAMSERVDAAPEWIVGALQVMLTIAYAAAEAETTLEVG